MNKEIINNKTFKIKILKKFLENFKNSKWDFDGSNQERTQFLNDFFATENPDYGYGKFHKALITEHLKSYKYKKNKSSSTFFKDLIFGSEMVGYNIGFTESVIDNSVFIKLDDQQQKLLHHYFYVRKIQEDLFSNLLISFKEIIEEFKVNKSVEYSSDFILIDEISHMFQAIYGLTCPNEESLKNAQFFQDYLIGDLNYKLNNEKLNEEDIVNIEKTMSSFWFLNNSSGYRLSSMYIEYLDFILKAENTYFKDISLTTRREHFVSYIVGSEDLISKNEILPYLTPQWNKKTLIFEKNLIKIQENNLLVFDINNLFTVDNETNIGKFFKRSKYISQIKIDRDYGSDYLSLTWELNETINQEQKEQVNNMISLFFIDKLENIDVYANDIASLNERLKNECRELDLLISLENKNEEIKKVRRSKI